MLDENLLGRIVCDPEILVGKPVIKGTRLSVEYILNLLGHGASPEEILDEYPTLKIEDVRACQLFASRSMADTTFFPLREIA